jgi:hypothetical protein
MAGAADAWERLDLGAEEERAPENHNTYGKSAVELGPTNSKVGRQTFSTHGPPPVLARESAPTGRARVLGPGSPGVAEVMTGQSVPCPMPLSIYLALLLLLVLLQTVAQKMYVTQDNYAS